MGETTRSTSRRSLLGRGFLFAAGAFGIGAARREESARAAPLAPGRTRTLRLYGRNFQLHAHDRLAGQVPGKGDRHSGYGELLDRPNGRVVGHFASAHMTHESPYTTVAASHELHTFSLKDGTIHGFGLSPRGGEGHFVILGGTGRYVGAQGSYVARQRQRELGGNGAAEFHLTLEGR